MIERGVIILFISILTVYFILFFIGLFRKLVYLPKGIITMPEANDGTRVWILGNVIKVRKLPGLVVYAANSGNYYAGETSLDRNNKFDKCFYVQDFDLKENEEEQIKNMKFIGVCFYLFGLIVEETAGRVAQVESLKNGCFRVYIIFE